MTATRPTPAADEPPRALFRPIGPEEVPTGWWAYGRAIWPLGDDITDDRVLVEGTDRRSYAALNHYLRGGHDTATDRARGLPRDIPAITKGRVEFERAGDTVRVTTHPDQAPTAAPIAVLIAER